MLSFDEFSALCDARFSRRMFGERPVSKEQIRALLQTAILAPSIENTQPWHFHVILNSEKIERVLSSSCYGKFQNMPSACIVVTCDKAAKPSSSEIVWNPRELEYSCVSAMEHILLGATALGLHSCWLSLHHGGAHEALNLRESNTVVGGILLGSMKETPQDSVRHERKSVDSTVTYYD